MPVEFSRAYIAYTEMTQPSIIFDSECVVRYTNEIYWRAKIILVEYSKINWLALYLFLIIGTGLVLIVGTVLTTLYLCKGRYKEVKLEEVKEVPTIEDGKSGAGSLIGPGPSAVRETELI